MQEGQLKQHTKAKGETGNHPQKVREQPEEGSGDVRKTTPMPEKKYQHKGEMALVKPRGSTYARASLQVAGKWRI